METSVHPPYFFTFIPGNLKAKNKIYVGEEKVFFFHEGREFFMKSGEKFFCVLKILFFNMRKFSETFFLSLLIMAVNGDERGGSREKFDNNFAC